MMQRVSQAIGRVPERGVWQLRRAVEHRLGAARQRLPRLYGGAIIIPLQVPAYART
jgi:hypothetical protein